MQENRTSPTTKLRRARLERTAAIICVVLVATGSIVQHWLY